MRSRRSPIKLILSLVFFVRTRSGIIVHRVDPLPLEIADMLAQSFLVEGVGPSCAFVHQAFGPPSVVGFCRAGYGPGGSLLCCWEGADLLAEEGCKLRCRESLPWDRQILGNGMSGENLLVEIVEYRRIIARYQLLLPCLWICESEFFFFV